MTEEDTRMQNAADCAMKKKSVTRAKLNKRSGGHDEAHYFYDSHN